MEARLFDEGTIPEWTTPGWYDGREAAPHLEQEGHRQRLELAARMVRQVTPFGPVLDLGAGDGGLLWLLKQYGVEGWGVDLQQTNVDAAAVRGVDVRLDDAVALVGPGGGLKSTPHVVVACEMLEHLVDPHSLVADVHANTGAAYLVASSPYTETAADHYGFHTWAWDIPGYTAMLEGAGWHVIETGTAWICQVVLAQRAER